MTFKTFTFMSLSPSRKSVCPSGQHGSYPCGPAVSTGPTDAGSLPAPVIPMRVEDNEPLPDRGGLSHLHTLSPASFPQLPSFPISHNLPRARSIIAGVG